MFKIKTGIESLAWQEALGQGPLQLRQSDSLRSQRGVSESLLKFVVKTFKESPLILCCSKSMFVGTCIFLNWPPWTTILGAQPLTSLVSHTLAKQYAHQGAAAAVAAAAAATKT